MADSILTDGERRLLVELERRGVRYLVVGMSAALLQGARGATEDIDLWFEDLADPRIGEAVRAGSSPVRASPQPFQMWRLALRNQFRRGRLCRRM
jgi:hypothetical protein